MRVPPSTWESRSFRRCVAAALVLALSACNSDSLTLPSEGEPAHVTILQGNDQQGQVGQPLTLELSVSITDAADRPVPDRAVSFNITSGSVIPAVPITNGQGIATFSWTLGPVSGSQALEAGVSLEGTLLPKAIFNATADPGPVAAVALIGGDDQTGQAGTLLPQALVVMVEDQYGNPIAGTDVIWQAANGNLSDGVVTTGSDGTASVTWTLGPTSGDQLASALVQGATGSPQMFSAFATQAPPPVLALAAQPSTPVRSGVPFTQQPRIQLEDAQGNPIAQGGVSVTAAIATGGGSLNGSTTMITDNAGVAQFLDLSISGAPGDRTLIFAAAGHTAVISAVVTVTASAPSPTASTISAAPTTIEAGTESSTITVTAKDDAGNPIAGLPVVIAVSGSGNTVVQPPGFTDANGVAIGTISSVVAESKSVTARIAGVGVTQSASISVVPGPPAAGNTDANVPDGRRLQFTTIVITTRDAFDNPLTAGGFRSQLNVVITGANNANPNISDNGDGTYSAIYFPIFKGNDRVDITLNGVPIKGSPYTSHVK
jgi:adhesin/invasin